jgi:hypothetical protein
LTLATASGELPFDVQRTRTELVVEAFRWWSADKRQTTALLEAHELQLLIAGGNPAAAQAAPMCRRITPTI